MNILYILGNGFDLQLGLPTSYSDFYKYYVSIESKSEAIKKLKEAIKEKPKDWSDLEIALGEYTSQTNKVEEFTEVYDDLQIALHDYILKVDEMVESGELYLNTNKDMLIKGFRFPEKAFDQDAAYTIEGEYDIVSNRDTDRELVSHSNLVTFNYTHVPEKYLGDLLHSIHAGYPRFINTIKHIHREVLNNQSIWLGVDNETQISNELFREDPDISYRLIKPKIVTSSNVRLVNDVKHLIETAHVIVIFGASLGPSDMTWAKLLAQHIVLGAIVLLFIHNDKYYSTDNAKLIDRNIYKSEFVDKMKDYGVEISDDSRIFVEINSSMFTDNTPNNHDKNLKLVLDKLQGSI